MKRMFRVQKSDKNIDIQQRPHLNTFFVTKFVYEAVSDKYSTSGKQRNPISNLRFSRLAGLANKAFSRHSRYHFAGSTSFGSGSFLSRFQDIFFNIERRSHMVMILHQRIRCQCIFGRRKAQRRPANHRSLLRFCGGYLSRLFTTSQLMFAKKDSMYLARSLGA